MAKVTAAFLQVFTINIHSHSIRKLILCCA